MRQAQLSGSNGRQVPALIRAAFAARINRVGSHVIAGWGAAARRPHPTGYSAFAISVRRSASAIWTSRVSDSRCLPASSIPLRAMV
jgi:hypothetical protein